MRMMIRAIRLLDDLAEVLIFDLILASKLGRYLSMGLIVWAGMVCYLVSGWVVAPTPAPSADLGSQRMAALPFDVDPVKRLGERLEGVVHGVARDGRLCRDTARSLAPWLEAEREALDSAVRLAREEPPVTFGRTPDYRYLRMLANALVARGLVLADRGQGDDAVEDWIAATRIGRAILRDRSREPCVIGLMVATGIERIAVRACTNHGRSGRMTARQAGRLLEHVASRSLDAGTLASAVRAEGRLILASIQEYGRSNRWSGVLSGLDRVLRLMLPWREGPRRRAARALEDSVGAIFQAHALAAEGRRPWPEMAEFPQLVPLRTSGLGHVGEGLGAGLAMVLPWKGIEWVSRAIVLCTVPDARRALVRMEEAQREADALRTLCNQAILRGAMGSRIHGRTHRGPRGRCGC